MSLITCCPACGTKFRVVADQLRISDGWVRCGRCQEVFDAQLALQTVTPSVTHGPAPVAPPGPVPAPAAAAPLAVVAPQAQAASVPVPPAAPGRPTPDRGDAWPVPPDSAPAADTDAGVDAPHAAPPSPSAQWEVLPSAPSPAPVVRDLRAASAPDLPAVEVVRTPAPAQAPAAAAPLDADAEPAWDLGELEFPDADAAQAPAGAAVEAMAQEFAQEMAAGGALGLGARAAATAAPVAQGLPPQPAAAAAMQGLPEQAAAQPVAPGPAARVPDAEQLPEPPRAAEPAAAPDAVADTGLVEDEPAAMGPAVPEFMKQAQRKAWWNQPAVRFVMGMLVMLLPLALVLQIVVQERNALAAWQPAWRPALENLCVALGCTLAPRQDIAAVVVSDSHFAATGEPLSYLFEVSLHNRSGAAVAMPALEVTLTDSQEQVLVRKVLLPRDVGAPAELGPRAEWSAQLPVTTPGLQLPVSGYRLTVFYP